MVVQKKSKNQLRRERQKLKKLEKKESTKDVSKRIAGPRKEIKPLLSDNSTTVIKEDSGEETSKFFELEFELNKILSTPEFSQFKHVFDRFNPEDMVKEDDSKGVIIESDDEKDNNELYKDFADEEKENTQKISKKKQRKANKMSLAELKTKAKFPELVHWYDVDAVDPKLVVSIKSHKNFVPVPVHWQHKREYLSGRRGLEKKTFTLPKYIADTGITDMRDTTKEDEKSLKQISREKVQPKMNRLDMDYQKLYDAFFKFQTKPRLFGFGDIYFEGREAEELDISRFKPGVISQELRDALGIPKGVSASWVAKMKHLGPPPSYPDLLIPGYNTDVEQEVIDFNQAITNDEEPFGKLLAYEESSEEGDDEEAEEEVHEEEESEEGEKVALLPREDIEMFLPTAQAIKQRKEESTKQIEPLYDEAESKEEDVPLAEVSIKEQTENIEPKKLYQVLKERVQSEKGFLSSGKTYDLNPSNKRKVPVPEESTQAEKRVKKEQNNDEEDEEEEEEEDEDDDEGIKFKF